LLSGPESLPAHSSVEATFSATAFLGLGLWQGAGIYYNPEIDRLWRRQHIRRRRRAARQSGGINLEQQITLSLGLFARLSMARGQYETFDFTEVERSASGGVVISGDLWGREKDQIDI
jgi:hypothetical protein